MLSLSFNGRPVYGAVVVKRSVLVKKAAEHSREGKANITLGSFESAARNFAKSAKYYWQAGMINSAVASVISACDAMEDSGAFIDDAREGHRVVAIMVLRQTSNPTPAVTLMDHLLESNRKLLERRLLTEDEWETDMDLYKYVIEESKKCESKLQG